MDFLEKATDTDIWTVNRYLTNPSGDGGQTRIPILKMVGRDGTIQEANTNENKAKMLAEAFFPPKPAASMVPQGYNYPDPCPEMPTVTEKQI